METFSWHVQVQGFENTGACQKGIAHTIWPNDCANQAQNKATADMIRSVDPNFLTSKHPNCALEGGVFFWLALLSPEQVELLKASTLATVSAILPNAPWELGGSVSARPAEMPLPGNSQRKSRSIGKREAVEVISQSSAPIGLSFLSTAEGTANSLNGMITSRRQAREFACICLIQEWIQATRPLRVLGLSGIGRSM